MTWEDFAAARQLLAEMHIGAPRRIQIAAQRAAEDAQYAATKAELRKMGPPVVLKPREPVAAALIHPRPIGEDEVVA